jgi:Apea-like HEPN
MQSLVWTKQGDSWRGEQQLKPDLFRIFMAGENELTSNGAEFTRLFFENYPKYNETVCFVGFGTDSLGYDQNRLFKSVISRIWTCNGTFSCDDFAVNKIVEEVEQFVKQSTITVRFQSRLLNFQMTRDTLELTDSLIIRRLSEYEISELYKESDKFHELCEFVIEGEETVKMTFGSLPEYPESYFNLSEKIRDMLDKSILCLRTFKDGIVGCNHIRFEPVDFFPFIGFGTYGKINIFVPLGRYELFENEISRFNEYANLVSKVSEPSMEMALSRLADAEIRTRPQDKIMDAVVGMEALLLAGLGKEDRRGELKYRFSIHFSTLFDSPHDRHNAFRVAKDLYDLRSTIAHGSSLTKDEFRIGDEKHLNLVEASKRATETLRMVIQYFLPKVGSATYKNHEFWERAYFNLEGTSLDPKDVQTIKNKL